MVLFDLYMGSWVTTELRVFARIVPSAHLIGAADGEVVYTVREVERFTSPGTTLSWFLLTRAL